MSRPGVENEPTYLLVLGGEEPLGKLLCCELPSRLLIDGALFIEQPVSVRCGFLGFYNWLFSAEGELLGVDQSFNSGAEELRDRVREVVRAYATEDALDLRVQWREGIVDIDSSIQENFGDNELFVARSEATLAISFSVHELNEDQLRTLPSGIERVEDGGMLASLGRWFAGRKRRARPDAPNE